MRTISLLVFTALTFSVLKADPHPLGAGAQAKAARDYGKLPVQFEENAGQTEAKVKYLARGDGYTLLLTADEAVMSVPGSKAAGGALRMQMLGANKQARMQGLEALPGRVNYMIGKDAANWHTGVATYAKVKYEQLYPGIDLIFYGKDGRLEYDFVLAPGADPSAIRLGLNGAAPRVDSKGNLVLSAGSEKVSFLKPVLFQIQGDRKERVSGGFVLAGNDEVRFQVGRYDHGRALVIDPVLVYASYLGGQRQTNINGLAVNGLGQLYVTGVTYALNFPTTPGVVQPAMVAAPDAFVSKISADGKTLLYSTYLGGDGVDSGNAIAVDGNDNAYVTGSTVSNNFPVTADAIQKQCGGPAPSCSPDTPDVFVAKLNPTGTQLLYSTFLGGSDSDSPSNIGLDTPGNVYIAGTTYSVTRNPTYPNGAAVNYPETPSAFQSAMTSQSGFAHAFITKLSPDLHTILYSSIIGGGNGGSSGNGTTGNFNQAMAVGQNGIVYIGGYTSSPQFPVTPGALQTTCPLCIASLAHGQAVDSGFISAFDTTQSGTASLVFSTYLDGTAPQNTSTIVHGLAADLQNNVYATGPTETNDFPVTSGTYSPTCSYPIANDYIGRCRDAFVLKLSPAGGLLWSTYYGSSAGYTATAQAIALDATGNVYIAGGGNATPGLPQVNPIQAGLDPTGGSNLFLATFSMDGSKLLFASYYGGNGSDIPSGVGLDSSGNIYAAGITTSSNFPTTAGAIQTQDPGPALTPFTQGSDPVQGFFLKASCINPTCPALPSLTINSISVAVNPNSAASGQLVTLTGAVVGQPGKPTPTGSVRFYSGPALVGQAPLDVNGVAVFTSSSLAAGTYAVTATYGGDSLYVGNTSAAQTLTISDLASQSSTAAAGLALTFSPNAQTVNLTATVTSASGAVNGGSVTFTLLGTTVSGVVNNGSANASFTVPGGTTAGVYQIQAAYSGTANFGTSGDASKQLTIGKATPVVTFSNPADISQGTALGSTQLNATASVPGTFVYTPPAGTVLPAGSGQTLSVLFTPTDTADYNPVTATAQIKVNNPAAATTITATNNVALTFSPTAQTITLTATLSSTPAVSGGAVAFTLLGTTVSGSVTAGSASAAFTVPAGTAAGNYPLQAAYTPTGSFTASSDNTKQLSIAKATPVLNFASPADINTGTALGSTQLNATSNVPGSFVYTPASGTVLPLGNGQTLLASFTPTDTADYNPALITALINVKANAPIPTSIAANGVSITFSPNTQTISLQALVTSSAGVPTGSVLFTLAGAQVSGVLNNGATSASYNVFGNSSVGNYPIQAVYVPTGNFAASSDNSKQLAITKATPVVSFANPADIVAGTALGSAQLHATANVPGTFVYTPAAGAVLPLGGGQTLLATFTPTDSTDYNTANGTAQINVKPAPIGPIATVTTLTTGAKVPYSPSLQTVTLSAHVSSAAGPVNGGSVLFSCSFCFPAPAAPLINGSATATVEVFAVFVIGYRRADAVFVPDPTLPYLASSDYSDYAYEVQGLVNWPTPVDIAFGTALSSEQLNATITLCQSCVGSGSPTYSPPAGTVLPVGRQLLSVSFIGPGALGSPPSTGNASVYINVLPSAVPGTPPNLVGSTIFSRDPVTNEILAQFTVSNTGGTVAPNSQITSFHIGETNAANTSTPLPQSLGSIGPGASSAPITFRLPANVGPPGRATFLFVSGTYAGYGWNYSSRITLP